MPGAEDFAQGPSQRLLEPFHAGRADLRDTGVAETVDDETRQAVGLAVHEAIVRRGVQALTQHERLPQARLEPGLVRNLPGLEQARAYQGLRVDVGQPQRAVIVREHAHEVSRREFRERRLLRVDFVAEDPEMAGLQPSIFIAPEPQRRQVRRRGGWLRQGQLPGAAVVAERAAPAIAVASFASARW